MADLDLSEGVLESEGSPASLKDMADSDLDKLIAGEEAQEEEPPAEESEPEAEPQGEEEKPAEEETEKAAPAPTPEALRIEALEARAEAQDAQIKAARAHASYLAAKLGDLKNKPADRRPATELGDEAEPSHENGEVLSRLDALELERKSEAVTRAIREVSMPLVADLNALRTAGRITDEDIQKASQPYDDEYKEVSEIESPKVARQMMTAILKSIRADALELARTRLAAEAEKRTTDEATRIKAKKLAASVEKSAPRSMPTTKQKPRNIREWSQEDLDAAYKEHFG